MKPDWAKEVADVQSGAVVGVVYDEGKRPGVRGISQQMAMAPESGA